MKEFIYKGKTSPDFFRFRKKELVIKGIAIKFEPEKNKTFFEIHYKTELNKEDAKKEIEDILDTWAKEMSLKYSQNIKYAEISFGLKDGITEGVFSIKSHLVTAKDSIDPTPKHTETINLFDYIKEALSLYRESLSAKNPFPYHYMICEAIRSLYKEEKICESDIKYNKTIRELANRYRHHKSRLKPPSKKCRDLLTIPKNKQLDIVRKHSKEIIQNCILYMQK